MNQQVKQKWLSALRSGDYKQTQDHLRINDRFCCLGVLCDLYGKEHNVEWNLVKDGTYSFQDNGAILPFPVVEWAGVGSRVPEICDTSLVELNDDGSTFNEIADLIEEHF